MSSFPTFSMFLCKISIILCCSWIPSWSWFSVETNEETSFLISLNYLFVLLNSTDLFVSVAISRLKFTFLSPSLCFLTLSLSFLFSYSSSFICSFNNLSFHSSSSDPSYLLSTLLFLVFADFLELLNELRI